VVYVRYNGVVRGVSTGSEVLSGNVSSQDESKKKRENFLGVNFWMFSSLAQVSATPVLTSNI
jgi:hypothetical protein